MSVPVKVLKACSYPGCEYISKSCSSATNEHNLGSHVSNFHAQKTKVWYGAVQITIFRDLKTKAFDCPCRAFTHIDASVVRRHAMKRHKGSADAQLAMENSLANRATTEEDVFLSPPPRQSASRDARKAPDIQRVSSAKTKAGTVLDSAALRQYKQTKLAAPQFSVASSSRPAVSLSSKRPREYVDDDTRDDIRPTKARKTNQTPIASTSSASDHRTISAAPTVPRVQTVSKSRSIHEAQPVSGWRSHIIAASSKTAVPRLNVKTASLPAAAPSSTKMSQSADSRQPMHHAKPALAFRRPVVSPPSSKRVIFDRLASDDLVEDSDDFEEEVIEVNPPPPDRRLPSDELECDVCFKRVKCGVHDPRIRSGWTCLMCRWAKLKGKTAARVAASSSTTSATVPRPKAQPATFSKPKAVESASSAGKRPIVAGSTILGRAPRQVTSAPSSDSEISGGSEPSHLYITDDQLERSTPSEPTLTPRGPVLKPPGRRPRMTKQRREREFRQWFDTFLEDYTVKKAAGTTTPNAGSEYVEYLRTAGGTAYTTADEFFAALATHVRAHQRSLAEGKKGVMPKFFGAFSIVAQPRINYESRAEKVKDRLRGIGLIFDDDDPSVEGLYDTRHDSLGQVVRSRQWIYPCNCGGTVNPKPHPSLKALHNNPHPLTPCFGKIMLEVGDDHALQKYGIKGQHIALRIIH